MRTRASSAAYPTLIDSENEKGGILVPSAARRMRRSIRSPSIIVLIALAFITASCFFLAQRFGGDIRKMNFGPQQRYDGPPGKHLVIASYTKQDVSWLEYIPSSWTPYRYFMDDPNPPNNLSVPNNLGREAMAYLTYIIDNYDDIPEYVIFTHGHYRSWHQVEPLDWKIRALNTTALDREGYINLRCEDYMGCETQPYLDVYNVNWPGERTLPDFWEAVLPDLPMPQHLSYKCCAQFAVTRKAIKQHPRERWERLRSPLLLDLDVLRTDEKWAAGPPAVNDWSIGIFWEKIWQVVFTGRGEVCPSQDVCRQEYFSNAILCAGDMDLSVWNSHWDDVHCISAFEDVAPDDEPDWEHWYTPSVFYSNTERVGRMRSAAYTDRDRRVEEAEVDRDRRVEEAQMELDRVHGNVETQQKILDRRARRIEELEERLRKLGHKP